VVTERGEIARHCKRSRSAADQRDALAVFRQRLWHAVLDVVFKVGSDALEAADRDRRFFDAAAAGRRARRDGRRCAPEFRETRSTSN